MHPIDRKGLILVISAPSGVGKTSLARALEAQDDKVSLSISVTTRPPRSGEKAGQDYDFVCPSDYETLVTQGAFLEYATVFEHSYGTPRAPVFNRLSLGQDVLLIVDWQGARQVAEIACEDQVSIFLLPPSLQELERRLRTRGQDSDAVILERMADAEVSISHYNDYDYVLVNRDFDETLLQMREILAAERLRRVRQTGLPYFVKGLFL